MGMGCRPEHSLSLAPGLRVTSAGPAHCAGPRQATPAGPAGTPSTDPAGRPADRRLFATERSSPRTAGGRRASGCSAARRDAERAPIKKVGLSKITDSQTMNNINRICINTQLTTLSKIDFLIPISLCSLAILNRTYNSV